mgnify:CR=1 FL=1
MLYFVSRVNTDSITYICKLCVYMEINLMFCSVMFCIVLLFTSVMVHRISEYIEVSLLLSFNLKIGC